MDLVAHGAGRGPARDLQWVQSVVPIGSGAERVCPT